MSGSHLGILRNETAQPPYFPDRIRCNVLSPIFYNHISARDLYISRIGLSVLLQPWTDPIGINKSLTDT